MSVHHLLPETPFVSQGNVANVAPSWVKTISESDDPEGSARDFYAAHTEPVLGPAHDVDGCAMVEVSFLSLHEPSQTPTYLLIGALHGSRVHDLTPFVMGQVSSTHLHQVTFLLPADGCYSYYFSSPDPEAMARAEGRAHLGLLYTARRMDTRHRRGLPSNGVSVWQGPAFRPHAAVDELPGAAEDLEHIVVRHDDGRERDVWLHRAHSGTSMTVVLFDGDAWRDLGIGAETWRKAGYDANLILMSSMEMADRTPDLTEPDRARRTLLDVLEVASTSWECVLTGDRTIVVGQSFGDLAVVSTVLENPDLANRGVCISGSFFFAPGMPMPPDLTRVGIHRQMLTSLNSPRGQLVMFSGRDEQIVEQSLAFLDEATAHGVEIVHFEQVRGTHDYAWWRHAIFMGLDIFLAN